MSIFTSLGPRMLLSVTITLLFVFLGSGYAPSWLAPLYKNSLIRNGVLILAAICSRIFIGEGLKKRQNNPSTTNLETTNQKEQKTSSDTLLKEDKGANKKEK